MYQMGNIVGKNGPTAFIMKEKRSKAAYADAFLVEHRCNSGPTIAMTNNTYMNDKAWVGITKLIVDGYQQIPSIQ